MEVFQANAGQRKPFERPKRKGCRVPFPEECWDRKAPGLESEMKTKLNKYIIMGI